MSCCCKGSLKSKSFTLIGVGVALIFFGIALVVFWETMFLKILSTQMDLKPGSMSFEMWKDPPVPIYLDLYLFNVTNPEEISKKGWSVKPELQELGPYVFKEEHQRVNLTWNDNGTLTFKQIRYWNMDAKQTHGSLEDKVNFPNPIALTMANLVMPKHPVIHLAVDWLLKYEKETLMENRHVREVLFEGYSKQLIELFLNITAPEFKIPFEKFGWFYGRNGSADWDGVFEIRTEVEHLGEIVNWNGASRTGQFPSPCDKVEGASTGELAAPMGPNPIKTFTLFVPDICSTMDLKLKGSAEYLGVSGVRYEASGRTLDNGTADSIDRCFAPSSDSRVLMPHGLRNATACRFGAPAFLSFPHFYDADPSLGQFVSGLEPDPAKHSIYLYAEPISGLPLRVQAVGQLNLRIENYDRVEMFKDAPTFYWPMLWFTQRAELNQELAEQLKMLVTAWAVGYYFSWALVCVGIILVLAGLGLLIKHLQR